MKVCTQELSVGWRGGEGERGESDTHMEDTIESILM